MNYGILSHICKYRCYKRRKSTFLFRRDSSGKESLQKIDLIVKKISILRLKIGEMEEDVSARRIAVRIVAIYRKLRSQSREIFVRNGLLRDVAIEPTRWSSRWFINIDSWEETEPAWRFSMGSDFGTRTQLRTLYPVQLQKHFRSRTAISFIARPLD